jgi:hypothetical protein
LDQDPGSRLDQDLALVVYVGGELTDKCNLIKYLGENSLLMSNHYLSLRILSSAASVISFG